MTPSRVPRPPGLADPAAATAVTASGVAAFAVTAAGGLTAWGTSVRGQLGAGPATRSTPATAEGLPFVLPPPPSSPSGTPWTGVAAGWGHAAAVDAAGGLSTWGHDGDGQLGRSAATAAARCVPALVAAPSGVYGNGGGGGWVGVAAGMDHTVGLDAHGGVHTWGCDAHGEAGHPPRRRRRRGFGRGPARVEAIDDSPAGGGGDSTAVVGSSGVVGGGKPSPPSPPSSPRRLVGLPPVATVAAGFAHTLLAASPSAGGGIWACGWDGDGQLGLGRRHGFDAGAADADASPGVDADVDADSEADTDNALGPPEDCVTSPTLLPASAGVVVTRLAAGRIHSAAVTDDGRLFTWGGGLHGRLGLDDFARYALTWSNEERGGRQRERVGGWLAAGLPRPHLRWAELWHPRGRRGCLFHPGVSSAMTACCRGRFLHKMRCAATDTAAALHLPATLLSWSVVM